jgi:hypothetical protein
MADLDKARKMLEYWSKPTRKTRVNDIDNDELIRLYTDGVSMYALALRYNKGQQFIKSRLIRANVYEGTEHKINKELNDKIREEAKKRNESGGR